MVHTLLGIMFGLKSLICVNGYHWGAKAFAASFN